MKATFIDVSSLDLTQSKVIQKEKFMIGIHPVAILCIALLSLLLFILGFAVSSARAKARVLIGMSSNTDSILNRLVRAHGNTAEHAPFLAILFLLLGARQPSSLVIGLIVTATISRWVFVLGLLSAESLKRPSIIRLLGALGTYVCGAWMSIVLMMGA